MGILRLASKPWTYIFIDGKETGLHTPQAHIALTVGSHEIMLRSIEHDLKETFTVEIRVGEITTAVKDLRP